jgi:predicted hydrolase (HD superfamily)
MSFLFGKKKKAAPVQTPTDRCESANETITKLQKKVEYQEAQTLKLRADAKAFVSDFNRTKNPVAKQKAMTLLKKAQVMESQSGKFRGMIASLETQMDGIQNAGFNAEIFAQFEKNVTVLEKLAAQVDPEKAQDVIDRLEEAFQQVDEVTDLLAAPIGLRPGIEEDAEDELNRLLEETQQEAAPGAAAAAATPAPVVTAGRTQADDAALEALMAEFVG